MDPFVKHSVMAALKNGDEIVFTVSSHSMVPALQAGDEVAVTPCGIHSHFHFGVFVCFEDDGEFIVHRYLGKFSKHGAEYVLTHGDASRHMDAPIPVSQVVGTVRIVTRGDKVIYNQRGWGIVTGYFKGLALLIQVVLFSGYRWIRNMFRHLFNPVAT